MSSADCTLEQAREALELWVKTTRWKRRGVAGVLVAIVITLLQNR